MIRFSKRLFSTAASSEQHFFAEKLPNGLVVFQINRPEKRNAISKLFLSQLGECIKAHQEAKAVILRSSKPGMFCAGADLKERKEMSEEEAKEFVKRLRATFTEFEDMQCPTIAVVDGPTMGGGLELAMCADLRVATKQAILSLPETSLAILPGAGGTQRLPRLIGLSKAKELIFTGDRVPADEAERIGLVNYACDDFDSAYQKAVEIAEKIGEKGPIAIRAAKEAISKGYDLGIKEGLKEEEKGYQKVFGTEDRLEGLRAFAEKRKPEYKGR